MKVSIDWLKDYIDIQTDATALKTLADGLTMVGLEIEETRVFTADEIKAAGGSGTRGDISWDGKVTPNRGDWLSMIGVAREAGPILGQKIRLPEPLYKESDALSTELIKIHIDAPDLCRRYVGVVIRGVTIKESPDWMKDRLIAAGMRPINNVVDITNYVMLELGQPLHAFDYNLLQGQEINIRRAKPGETIISIDNLERKLDQDMLVIADSTRPVAIAGVMGGFESEISEQTKDILIESANFNSVSIRRTAKRLNMTTESSYRFERGVDPAITLLAAKRAAQLISELAGGEVAKGAVDVYPVPVEPLKVSVRPERVNSILGTALESEAMTGYLNSIEIQASVAGDFIECAVPTFRSDITREIDIIEEIGRVYGYDNLSMTLPKSSLQGKDSKAGLFREKVRLVLMSCGCQEALTHSVIDSKVADLAGKSENRLDIRNPLTEDLGSMRVMLAPNLLQVVERNQAFGNANVSIFEIGKVYYKSPKIGEKLAVGGAVIGNLWNRSWGLPAKALDVDFFACKGIVESLLDGLGITCARFVETRDPLLHPTRAAKVLVGDKELGIVGEAAPDVVEALGVRGRPYIYELDFQALMDAKPDNVTYCEPPRFPAVNRHIAVVVNETVKYEQLASLARESGGGILEDIDLLDVYKGEHVGANQSSLTLGFVFRSREKTLTEDEVNTILADIKEALSDGVGASFR